MAYILTKERLRKELSTAFYMASRHKSNKGYVIDYKNSLDVNLDALTEALYKRDYKPQRSFCFIIHEPKIREIFAARFEDRIVHHLYFNMASKMFESLFIEDSYSCREGKGSHYGVRRLYGHVKKESQNYTKEVYVLQLDVRGYFISINRTILLSITERIFDKKESKYCECIDFDFIRYLNRVIILNDPSKNCIIRSPKEEWNDLPDSKSLFKTKKDCGLPIGNLTSQLLSNVYLNELDQYAKRVLGCKHYGRYVDDLYVVSKDREWLRWVAREIEKFIKENLGLSINKGKTHITNTRQGVQFLGYFIKHHRIYLCNGTLRRIEKAIKIDGNENSVNSYLGMFRQGRTFRMRRDLFRKSKWTQENGLFNDSYTKYIPFNKLKIA